MIGCGNSKCINRFCRSCSKRMPIEDDLVVVICFQLASRRHHTLLCDTSNAELSIPPNVFPSHNSYEKKNSNESRILYDHDGNDHYRDANFLKAIFTSSPFKSIYVVSQAAQEGRLGDNEGPRGIYFCHRGFLSNH